MRTDPFSRWRVKGRAGPIQARQWPTVQARRVNLAVVLTLASMLGAGGLPTLAAAQVAGGVLTADGRARLDVPAATAPTAADRGGRFGDLTERLLGAMNDLGVGTPRGEPGPRVLSPSAGVVDPQQPLTLLQAWEAAAENDPNWRAAKAAAAAGRERLPQAQAQLKPSVQLSGSVAWNRADRESIDFFGNPVSTLDRYRSDNQTLSVRQPLFRQQQQAQIRQAAFLVENSDATLARAQQELAVRVTGAYLEAMLARDQRALVQAQGRFLEVQRDAARQGLARGTGTRTDVDEAQARLDANRADELEARQQVELSRRQLQALVNRPFGELSEMDPRRLELEPPTPAAVEDWVDRAWDSSPEIRSLIAQRQAALEDIARARAGHLPTLDLLAQVQRSRSENVTAPRSGYVNSSVGLQLNLPLYQGGFVDSVQRQAQAEYERLGELLEAARLDMGVRVHREHRGVTEGIERVKALEVALRSAEVALASARASRLAGVRTLVDVLNAEQQRMVIVRDLARARYLTLMSVVRLHALTGQADRAVIQRVGASFDR